MCGFGPPYSGSFAIESRTGWEEKVFEDQTHISRDLWQLGWDDESIKYFIEEYQLIISSNLPIKNAQNAIKKLLGIRKIKIVKKFQETLRVPLFIFGSPAVENSKVCYSETLATERQYSWLVKIFGVGTGDTTTVVAKNICSYTASKGECKLIYVPIKMLVEQVEVFDGDNLIGSGYRGEVSKLKGGDHNPLEHRGIKTLERERCVNHPGGDFINELYMELSGDSSKSIHEKTFSWNSNLDEDMNLALGKTISISVGVKVKNTREISIKCEMPAGWDYHAVVYSNRLWWDK